MKYEVTYKGGKETRRSEFVQDADGNMRPKALAMALSKRMQKTLTGNATVLMVESLKKGRSWYENRQWTFYADGRIIEKALARAA